MEGLQVNIVLYIHAKLVANVVGWYITLPQEVQWIDRLLWDKVTYFSSITDKHNEFEYNESALTLILRGRAYVRAGCFENSTVMIINHLPLLHKLGST